MCLYVCVFNIVCGFLHITKLHIIKKKYLIAPNHHHTTQNETILAEVTRILILINEID